MKTAMGRESKKLPLVWVISFFSVVSAIRVAVSFCTFEGADQWTCGKE